MGKTLGFLFLGVAVTSFLLVPLDLLLGNPTEAIAHTLMGIFAVYLLRI